VLADMFERAGHKVTSWRRLSPRLQQRADCIVWFPDDFQPPPPKVRKWLEDWLEARSDRTLIYVGRDFDAASWYWREIAPGAPADQAAEIRMRKLTAEADFQSQRLKIPASEDCEWFTVRGASQPREVRTLEGDPRWVKGIDPKKLRIELNGRIDESSYGEALLASEGDLLVGAESIGDSRLIVVTNGSFLLNLPLVNHEHRKLAGRLIDQIGPPSKQVVFLESTAGGPPIADKDPAATMPTGLEIFHIWPTSWILLHMAVVGILLCFSRYPIFGLARDPGVEIAPDFGKHVEALGELLRRSRDTAYAVSRLVHYRQTSGEATGATASSAASSTPRHASMTSVPRSLNPEP
jgi:hypothetical protein